MRPSWPLTVATWCGWIALYLGERVVDPGNTRLVIDLLALALLVGATGLRFARGTSPREGARQVERWLFLLQLLGLVAAAMYFMQADAGAKLFGKPLDVTSPKLAGVLYALFPAVVGASLLPMLTVEMSYAAMSRSPFVEVGRVRDALFAGLGLALAITFAFSLEYVVSERDAKADFSYFRATKPGQSTKALVASFDEDVTAALFFPPANEVADLVDSYFDDLSKSSPKLKVVHFDHALEPQKAKDFGVSGNGVVVLAKGGRKESIFIGTELDKARTQLRGLDQEVNKKLLMVGRAKRVIYLTTGHGERSDQVMNTADQRQTIDLLRGELKNQNFELKTLSVADGLASEIPKDAAAVFIVGPTIAFTEPEGAALEAYGKKGGKLFIALDPEAGLQFKELLNPLGLTFTPTILANDAAFAVKTHTPADRQNIGTQSFSSHPSVSTNGRMGYPMFFIGAGILEEAKMHPADLIVDFAVRAMPNTWNDANNNFEFDAPTEIRKPYGLGAAVSRRKAGGQKIEEELRALVLADSDGVDDEVLNASKGNAYFVLDGLKWLLGDEATAGVVNQENDVPLTRTRAMDVAWFYGTTFLAPMAVLGLGLMLRRKAKRGVAAPPSSAVEVKP
jgi:hypothetical protein